jgi:hypothetical protein
MMPGAANCSFTSRFSAPLGVALDPTSGVLYVSNGGFKTLCRVPAGGGTCAYFCGEVT